MLTLFDTKNIIRKIYEKVKFIENYSKDFDESLVDKKGSIRTDIYEFYEINENIKFFRSKVSLEKGE